MLLPPTMEEDIHHRSSDHDNDSTDDGGANDSNKGLACGVPNEDVEVIDKETKEEDDDQNGERLDQIPSRGDDSGIDFIPPRSNETEETYIKRVLLRLLRYADNDDDYHSVPLHFYRQAFGMTTHQETLQKDKNFFYALLKLFAALVSQRMKMA